VNFQKVFCRGPIYFQILC